MFVYLISCLIDISFSHTSFSTFSIIYLTFYSILSAPLTGTLAFHSCGFVQLNVLSLCVTVCVTACSTELIEIKAFICMAPFWREAALEGFPEERHIK